MKDDDKGEAGGARAKAAGRNQRHRLAAHAMQGLVSPEVFARPSWSRAGDGGLPFEPCEEDYATAYLNRDVRARALRIGPIDRPTESMPTHPPFYHHPTFDPRQDVKAALHAKSDIKWEDCTDLVDYNQGDQLLYMEPLYNFLL